MSLTSWKSLAYPVTAEAAATDDITATKHALVKWEHLRPEVLKEHGVRKDGRFITDDEDNFLIGSGTCALCELHWKADTECASCPIAKLKGHVDSDCEYEFGLWIERHDPEPMIDLLKRTLARLEAGEGGGER